MSSTTDVSERKVTAASRKLAVARAGLALALVALAAWCLSLLGRVQPSGPAVETYRDGAGGEVRVITERGGAGFPSRTRFVLSRVPVALERRGALLRLAGGRTRVIPTTAAVLVHADGRLEPLEAGLPLPVVFALRRRPPRKGETFAAWFRKPSVRRDLQAAGVDLAGFWD